MEDWVMSEVIGSGSYGTVYLAKNSLRPVQHIAVKSSVFSKSSTLQQERIILEILKGCPEIIRCYGCQEIVAYNQKYYNLLLEYASGGTLSNLIKKRGGKLTEPEVKIYTRMILKGISCIHEKGYVHCDVKPSNILVFPSPSGVNHVRIADFGLAKKAEKSHTYAAGRGLDRFRGTPLYTSPESVKFGINEPPMDIWSLGCVMVEMFTGKPVWSFKDVHDLLFEIAYGQEDPDIPDGFSPNAKSFLIKCLVRDPKDRWTAKELLNHPFMVDQDSAHHDDQINKPLPSLTKPCQVVQHTDSSSSSYSSHHFNWIEEKLINHLFS